HVVGQQRHGAVVGGDAGDAVHGADRQVVDVREGEAVAGARDGGGQGVHVVVAGERHRASAADPQVRLGDRAGAADRAVVDQRQVSSTGRGNGGTDGDRPAARVADGEPAGGDGVEFRAGQAQRAGRVGAAPVDGRAGGSRLYGHVARARVDRGVHGRVVGRQRDRAAAGGDRVVHRQHAVRAAGGHRDRAAVGRDARDAVYRADRQAVDIREGETLA